MKTKLLCFKLLTGIASFYHVLLGLSALVLPEEKLKWVIDRVLGFSPEFDITLLLAVRFSGAYVLVFGLIAGLVCLKPERYRTLIFPVLLLFGIRLLNRLVLFQTLAETHSVTPFRNTFGLVSLAVLFFGILFTAPRNT